MGLPIRNRRVQVEGITAPESFKVEALKAVIPAGQIWHVCSGDCWSVNGIEIQGATLELPGAILRIDGEVHTWGDVTGSGAMTGEGELRLH